MQINALICNGFPGLLWIPSVLCSADMVSTFNSSQDSGQVGTKGLILQKLLYKYVCFWNPRNVQIFRIYTSRITFLNPIKSELDAVAEVIDMKQLFWGCSKVYINQAPWLFLNEPRITLFCLK